MQPSHQFDVGLQPSLPDEPIVLRSTVDPNHATMVFQEELERLTAEGAMGELVMLRYNDMPKPILRQSLEGSENRLGDLLEKLGVHSRLQALVLAARHGLVSIQ